MPNWSNKAWESLIEDYPDLSTKAESVAFAIWTLKNNPSIDATGLREAGEKAGLSIAGRAVGSARQILGLAPASGGRKKKRKKAGGRKKGTRRSASTSSSASGIDGLVEIIKATERENKNMRAALDRIRQVIDRALD